MKKNSGITILALIITIIILIILAIVSVSLVINSGILNKSEQGVNTYSKEEELEQLKLVIASAKLKGNGFLTTENLNSELKNKFGENKETIPKKDYWEFNGYNIYKDGKVEEFNSILPKEYQQVEYIESTGTQYIDTEVYPSSNLNIELDIALKSSEGDQKFFGSYGNGGICLGTLNNKWRYGSNTWQMNNGTATTDRILIIVEGNTFTFGNDKYTANSISDNTEHSMLLSAIAYRGSLYSKSKMTIFKTKISSEQNIIRDFIPCYRKSDNVKGLYDIVEGKFYTNQVTGDDFIAGENVY